MGGRSQAYDSTPVSTPPTVLAVDAAKASCMAVANTVSDEWCARSCGNTPPNCPPALCSCVGGTVPDMHLSMNDEKWKLKAQMTTATTATDPSEIYTAMPPLTAGMPPL